LLREIDLDCDCGCGNPGRGSFEPFFPFCVRWMQFRPRSPAKQAIVDHAAELAGIPALPHVLLCRCLFDGRPLPMPFTLAHPAAVMPLPRMLGRWCVYSALVVGSMTPDFVYFAPLGVSGEQSHSLAGVFWFCVPAGFVALLVFHALLKRPIIFLLPASVQSSLTPYAQSRSPRGGWRWLPIVVCLAIGALTHVAWDAFTHRGTPAVEMFPVLDTTVASARGHELRVYKMLQHGSTLVGMAAVGAGALLWLRRNPGTAATALAPWSARQRTILVAMLMLLPCAVGAAAASARPGRPVDFKSLQSFAGVAVTSGMAALAVELVALGVIALLAETVRSARDPAR
jgi:Domain of unknown function (DUF4184)